MKRLIYIVLLAVVFTGCKKDNIDPMAEKMGLLTNKGSKSWIMTSITSNGNAGTTCEIRTKGLYIFNVNKQFRKESPECSPPSFSEEFRFSQAYDSVYFNRSMKKIVTLTETDLVVRYNMPTRQLNGTTENMDFVETYKREN
jgi:hypothetical protein